MSDLMLHAVLNLPHELWRDDPIDIMQRHERYVEASRRIAELEAILAQRWLPIETAPKDGTEILAVVNGFTPSTCYWNTKYEMWLMEVEDEVPADYWEEYVLESSYHPTHWQPLPPQPQ